MLTLKLTLSTDDGLALSDTLKFNEDEHIPGFIEERLEELCYLLANAQHARARLQPEEVFGTPPGGSVPLSHFPGRA